MVVLDKHQHFTSQLHRSGGMIVGGTDCGVGYPPTGFILLRELEMLADSMGAVDAIRAVTSVAARHLWREDDIGAVAPGRYADLLVMDGDPVHDVRDFRKLVTVFRGGVAHDPKELMDSVAQQAQPAPRGP